MYQIIKLHDECTINFAAEELKKYLRMMMPQTGNVRIITNPKEVNGYRLGLLEDFSLPFTGKDPALDDEIYIDTDENGGILAGSNPRSVLFSVYRFLKQNGCRFLFPGTDGEFIPKKQVKGVCYHKLADHRYRGHTTEGDPSIEDVLRYIDYHAKQEMNVYALYEIFPYHRRYYLHRYNESNRPPEPVDRELVAQWQALCECELSKRGVEVWGGGHGWVDRVAGFNMNDRYLYRDGKELSPEIRENLAVLDGVRGLYRNDPSYTNICMSKSHLRTKMAKLVADYTESHNQISQISVSLADTSHNHCECDKCQERTPSDWYVMILNEIDAILTERNIRTKLQMSAYVDCMFAPERERLKNPDRFILKATPISRDYTKSIDDNSVFPMPAAYIRNKWKTPQSTEEYFALFKTWQSVFPGCSIAYEYHYWLHQYRDPGMMAMSRRVYEDVRSWKTLGLDGGIQDGSNKSFFPNGFIDYIYGATLMDRTLDYDAALEDYFLHVYGEDWKLVKDYLDTITSLFDHAYMCGKKSAAPEKGELYNPEHAQKLLSVKKVTDQFRNTIYAHLSMPTRPQSLCWRLLLRHTQWCDGLADAFALKAQGDTAGALSAIEQFAKDFGKNDFETEHYFDFGLAMASITSILKKRPITEF